VLGLAEKAAEVDASLDQLLERRGADKVMEERDEEDRDVAMLRLCIDGAYETRAHGDLDCLSVPGPPSARGWAERENELLPGGSELAGGAVEAFEHNALDGRVETLSLERRMRFARGCDRRGHATRGAVRKLHNEKRE
jgi:hypothetical protein